MTRTLERAAEVLWAPHEGPQSAFLASDGYEGLYGGAAGGGKSDALLFGGLRQIAHPDYKALMIRRSFPELTELMDRAHGVFTQLGGTWNESKKRYTFPSGSIYQFGYCESYRDVLQYQGQQFTYIAGDELGQWPEERMWTYLASRNRAAAPGLVKQMRASANPGGPGHAWLKRRFISQCKPDGTLTTVPLGDGSTVTRFFVQAFLRDNPTLMENDPGYASRLLLLPELERRWLADGDWDAGAGMAFSDLSRQKHLVASFDAVPPHWTIFGSFDWGYAHPFCFCLWAADDSGNVYLLDATHGRRLQPPEIADRILDTLDANAIEPSRLRYVSAGHDCWADVRARAENIPTIAEHFARLGIPLVRANISRVSGVQNCRRYLASSDTEPPRHRIVDTQGTRTVWECLESRVSDPDHPEDVLKTDADESGEGGDDPFDAWRYGLASRPIVAKLSKDTATRDDRAARVDWKQGTVAVKRQPESVEDIYTREQRRVRPNVVRPRW